VPDLGLRLLCIPLPTLRRSSRAAPHGAGPMWFRYSLIVVDWHHLIFAGLPAHTRSYSFSSRLCRGDGGGGAGEASRRLTASFGKALFWFGKALFWPPNIVNVAE